MQVCILKTTDKKTKKKYRGGGDVKAYVLINTKDKEQIQKAKDIMEAAKGIGASPASKNKPNQTIDGKPPETPATPAAAATPAAPTAPTAAPTAPAAPATPEASAEQKKAEAEALQKAVEAKT